ncbi:MAG TPA: hypothetical protein PLS49_05320, partial [Candidatus Woesebacteria bacterium]|nr:hypothetical protein [Candidatus Woesebacteria bacterium]
IAKLKFNNTELTTTYTDAGGGWWRLTAPITIPVDTSYLNSNIDSDQGLYNSTTSIYLAQSFKTTQNINLDKALLSLKKVGGTPTTTHYRVQIQSDVGNNPSGGVVTNGNSNCLAVTTSSTYTDVTFTFSNVSLLVNTLYHLVLIPYTNSTCSTVQSSENSTNYISWGFDNSTSTYGLGNKNKYDGSVWTLESDKDHAFQIFGGKSFDTGIDVSPGKTIFIDGFQLEPVSHVTSYADGSLGTGYSWTGTANESTSTRTMNDVRYPYTGNLSTTSGTYSFWFMPTWNSTESSYDFIVSMGSNIGCGFLRFATLPNSLRLYDGCTNTISKSATWNPNTWHHVVVVWDTNYMNFYFDGSPATPSSTFSGSSISYIHILGGGNDSQIPQKAATISNFVVHNRPLNDSEVLGLYYSGLSTHTQNAVDDKKFKTTADYESGVLDLGNAGQWGLSPNLLITETLNGNTTNYQTRSSEDNLVWSDYAAVTGTTPNLSISSPPKRYLQVKATLNSPNQNSTPEFNGAQI